VVWENVGHTNWWREKTAVKMSPWKTRFRSPSGEEPETTEVDLHLDARWRVVHPDGHGPATSSAALGGEPGQGPVWDHHPFAGEQDPDLGDRESLLHPGGDLLLLGNEPVPRLAVAVGSVRTEPLDELTDQFVGALFLTAGPCEPERHTCRDVAADCLAIDADPLGDRAFALTLQPAPEHVFDLDHRYLPECHGRSSPAASRPSRM
jgi:hypothetical protein